MEEEKLSTKNSQENIEYLNLVNSNMREMEGKLQKVSSDFNVLQDEMKKSLMDNKKNTILLNARQSLMMLQNEYDKKYSHRDYIRRKVIGILQAGDLNTVKASTMETIGESALIDNPDYWLAPALLALCAWYNNKKELASRALTEAIHRNAEMTSLLLCFIHLRAGRIETATKWLNKYLDMQVPREIDSKISLIIDAMTSGVFPYTMQNLALTKIDSWLKDLETYKEYENIYQKEKDIWIKYLKEIKESKVQNNFAYLEEYVQDGKEKIEFINNLDNTTAIKKNIEKILTKQEEQDYAYTDKIDKLINRLIFSHDDNEEKIKDEMYKNKCLIDNYGDEVKANELYGKNREFVKNYNDLFTELTRIVIYDDKTFDNSKKFSISLLGYFIVEAYKELLGYNHVFKEEIKQIKITNTPLSTIDGQNEIELVSSMSKEMDEEYNNFIKEHQLFNILNIISMIGIIIGIILIFTIPILGYIITIISIGYNVYTTFQRLNYRKTRRKEIENLKQGKKILLLNTIAEIVDYHFILEETKEEIDEFINYINNLNPNDYLKKDSENNNRNIEIGDKYE